MGNATVMLHQIDICFYLSLISFETTKKKTNEKENDNLSPYKGYLMVRD